MMDENMQWRISGDHSIRFKKTISDYAKAQTLLK